LPLATAPIALPLVVAVAKKEGKALNPYLGKTAKLLLLHASLLAAGIAMSARVAG
jgi:hypothetical protein